MKKCLSSNSMSGPVRGAKDALSDRHTGGEAFGDLGV